jgi:environmental stress-induced protein Ves
MRHLPASDRKPAPWKNGGGVTVEVAIHPEGASLDGFAWRISLATVASDGPFSLFPGIDRTLTVLTGAGIDLAVAGQSIKRLDPGSLPFSFPGDVPTAATLVAGPIEDLNVMTRRGVARHDVARHALAAGDRRLIACPVGIVLVTGACRFGDLDLAPRDTVRIEAAETVPVVPLEDGFLFSIALG